MAFSRGDIVRVRVFAKRPSHWNEIGAMDYWMGKVVTICSVISNGNIRIVEDNLKHSYSETTEEAMSAASTGLSTMTDKYKRAGGWNWRASDFEGVGYGYNLNNVKRLDPNFLFKRKRR